jgi:hypothetical protein
VRRLEVQLQGFFEIGKGFFFALTLACDIYFEALGHVPIPFAPDGRGERSLHDHILSQEDWDSLVSPSAERFQQSLVAMVNHVDAMSPSERVSSEEAADMVVPP